MIIKIYRPSSCKYINDRKCDYKIDVCTEQDYNPSNKIQPSDEPFEDTDAKINEELITELRTKLEELGDSPDDADAQDMYKYLYSEFVTSSCKDGKYPQEILSLQKQALDSTHTYNVGEPGADGKFSREQTFSSWFFDTTSDTLSDTASDTVYLVHLFTDDKGCGCWNNSQPLAVFTDKSKASNFLKKCEYFARKCGDDWNRYYAHLDTYTLNTGTDTFEKVT